MKFRFVSYFLHINQCKLRDALRRPARVHLPPVSEPASGAAGASSARVWLRLCGRLRRLFLRNFLLRRLQAEFDDAHRVGLGIIPNESKPVSSGIPRLWRRASSVCATLSLPSACQ